jgi:peptidyl-prolyl cis-trans isomerase SurA
MTALLSQCGHKNFPFCGEWSKRGAIEERASSEYAMPHDRSAKDNHRPNFGPLRALLGFLLIFLFATPASAQVAALVNGDPITALDIAQRTRLIEVFSRKKTPRNEVLEELIDEKVKLDQARRKGIEITDKQVDDGLATMAPNRKASDFIKAIEKEGIDKTRFRTRLRAQLAWRQVLEQGSPGVFQIRDADLVAILNAHGETPLTKGMQYTLQPIIFVVARRAPDSTKTARLKEAEAFRSRIQGCDEAVAQARAIPETVVKDRMDRFSLDLGTQYRKLIDSIPDGKMTPAEVTTAGIELVVVCGRKEVIADISSRKEFRQELLSKRLSEFEKQYLADLRKQVIIEYR